MFGERQSNIDAGQVVQKLLNMFCDVMLCNIIPGDFTQTCNAFCYLSQNDWNGVTPFFKNGAV